MYEGIYRKEVTINHKYFKTQKHYINFHKKLMSDYKHEALTEPNLKLFAWILSNRNKFLTYGVEIPVDKIHFNIKKGDLSLLDKLNKNIKILRKLKDGKISLHECNNNLSIDFPILNELEYRQLLARDKNYSDEFIKTYDSLYNVKGVYFLYNLKKKLIYIGKSINLSSRLITSSNERKAFYCKYLITKTNADANILEPYYIATLKPELNGDLTTLDLPTFKIDHKFKISKLIKIFK